MPSQRTAARLSLRDLKGYADPRADNAPTYLRRHGRTAPAPAWNVNPVTLHDQGALTLYRDRARMVQSPLMDAKGYARAIEAAYRRIWRSWCAI